MENRWAKSAAEGKTIEVEIEIVYSNNSKRPDRFIVTEKIDGKMNKIPFKNQAGG